jgi:hypothetical protein
MLKSTPAGPLLSDVPDSGGRGGGYGPAQPAQKGTIFVGRSISLGTVSTGNGSMAGAAASLYVGGGGSPAKRGLPAIQGERAADSPLKPK